MRDLRACVLALPLIAGCSFDFTGFASGSSGSAAASGASGSASASSGAGGNASATSSGSGVVTTSTSTTGGAGGAGVLTRCGGFQDTFNSFDTTKWLTHATVTEMANHLHTKIDTDPGYAEAYLKTTAQFDECYATTRVFSYPNNDTVAYLRVEQGANLSQISYDKNQKALTTPGRAAFDPGFDPDVLGMVFHAGQVYFLIYENGNGWTHVQTIPREAWMSDGPDDTIAIGAGPGPQNELAIFDDFNVTPITIADLP